MSTTGDQPSESPGVQNRSGDAEHRSPSTVEFAEDTPSLLAKYANYPPSLELHIHSTHYRFGGQEGIIPRDNPLMDVFLQNVRDGEIPAVAGEVFRDSGIPLYEGCAILKLVDYRGFTQKSSSGETDGLNKMNEPRNSHTGRDHTPAASSASGTAASAPDTASSAASGAASSADNPQDTATDSATDPAGASGASGTAADAPGAADGPTDTKPAEHQNDPSNVGESNENSSSDIPVKKESPAATPAAPTKEEPPSFRVLLRPTGPSMQNDVLGLSDNNNGRKLTDQFAIDLESEMLNMTVRKLYLQVPPMKLFHTDLHAALKLQKPQTKQRYFRNRLTHPRKPRRITEDSPHKGTAYEEFMLGMADQDKPTRNASQFSRMSFVEQIRRKKHIAAPGAAPAPPRNKAVSIPPSNVQQPTPAQLAKQLYQSQQIAAQARMASEAQKQAAQSAQASLPAQSAQPTPQAQRAQLQGQLPPGQAPLPRAGQPQNPMQAQSQQQPMQTPSQTALNLNHIPPGPTAQHQIQAQAQKQNILRARAQHEQMLQQRASGQGMGMPQQQHGMGTPQPNSRPVSAMGQMGQRMNHSMGQMGQPMNGPMNGPMQQMNGPMPPHMQMSMSPQMGMNQMNQMDQMGNMMNGMGDQMMNPMGQMNQVNQMNMMGSNRRMPQANHNQHQMNNMNGMNGMNGMNNMLNMVPNNGMPGSPMINSMTPMENSMSPGPGASSPNMPSQMGMHGRQTPQLTPAQMRQIAMNRNNQQLNGMM